MTKEEFEKLMLKEHESNWSLLRSIARATNKQKEDMGFTTYDSLCKLILSQESKLEKIRKEFFQD